MEKYFQSIPAIIRYLSQHIEVKEEASERENDVGEEQEVKRAPSLEDSSYMGVEANNEKEEMGKTERKTCRRPSIKVKEQEKEEEYAKEKEEDLPKTDLFLPNAPPTQPLYLRQAVRPNISHNFAEHTITPPHGPFQFLHPSIFPQFPPPYPFSPFSPFSPESSSECLNCHNLFLAWRDRASFLASDPKY
jgi:hypothetical protein